MQHDKAVALLALYRVGRHIKFSAKHRSTDSMLTAAILLTLEKSPITLSELGEHLAMKPAAMSEQVAKLASYKLIAKKSGEDRRSKTLSLTAAGKRGADEIRKALGDHAAIVLRALSAAEVQVLVKLLERLAI